MNKCEYCFTPRKANESSCHKCGAPLPVQAVQETYLDMYKKGMDFTLEGYIISLSTQTDGFGNEVSTFELSATGKGSRPYEVLCVGGLNNTMKALYKKGLHVIVKGNLLNHSNKYTMLAYEIRLVAEWKDIWNEAMKGWKDGHR